MYVGGIRTEAMFVWLASMKPLTRFSDFSYGLLRARATWGCVFRFGSR